MSRLSVRIRILALGLALWHLQAGQQIVSAQKYYMNFAFNNNNPQANNEVGDHAINGAAPRESSDAITNRQTENMYRGESSGSAHSQAESGNTDNNDGSEGISRPQNSGSGGNDNDNGSNGDGDSDGYGGHGSASFRGLDADDDDSDSEDPRDRREKLEEAEDNQDGDAHNHHSSYEISIDDSFGGRYVRSIYESSESHGHPGASELSRVNNEHSESDDKLERLYGDDDYEEFNGE